MTGSAQERWLRTDLATHATKCTLAYFHHPRFTSLAPTLTTDGSTLPLWQALYDANADLILNGHAHVYERFQPQTPLGVVDDARGISEITVGTGGGEHHENWGTSRAAHSEIFDDHTWGVLKLTLNAASYDWQFVPVAGASLNDSGSGACH